MTQSPALPRPGSTCWATGGMEPLARELDFEFIRNGSLVLCLDEADRPKLAALAARGLQNGVPGLRLLTGEEGAQAGAEPQRAVRCGAVRADRRHCLPVRADHCAGRKRLRQRGGLSLFDRRDSRSPHGRRLPA